MSFPLCNRVQRIISNKSSAQIVFYGIKLINGYKKNIVCQKIIDRQQAL